MINLLRAFAFGYLKKYIFYTLKSYFFYIIILFCNLSNISGLVFQPYSFIYSFLSLSTQLFHSFYIFSFETNQIKLYIFVLQPRYSSLYIYKLTVHSCQKFCSNNNSNKACFGLWECKIAIWGVGCGLHPHELFTFFSF